MTNASNDPKDVAPVEGENAVSTESEIDSFIAQVKSRTPPPDASGRLIFAMDATMSRQPTWDRALSIQADMFAATQAIGGLEVQLVYFRGFGECRASRWVKDASALARLMTQVSCRGGHTQIGKVLSRARSEAEKKPVSALVYVGDAMEENIDDLCARAGELGLLRLPAFMFHEGLDPMAGAAFKEIARLSGGAYCRFDSASADRLKELLQAVAVYATGGMKALEAGPSTSGARLLIEQLR